MLLISRMTNDVEALDSLVTDSVVTLFQSGLTLLGTVGILLYLDVNLALITFLVLPLLLAGSLWFRIVSAGAFRRTRRRSVRSPPSCRRASPASGSCGASPRSRPHKARFTELNADNQDANMVTVKLNAAYFPTVEMLSGVAVAVIVIYGGLQAINGHVTVGTVVAFVAALANLFEPIQQLSQLYATYQSGMAALEKIFQLLDVKPRSLGPPRRHAAGADPWRSPLRGCLLRLRQAARQGRRGREGRDRPRPRPGRPDHPPGQTVALVGATGAGSRRWRSSSPASMTRPRAVLVDGHDLR